MAISLPVANGVTCHAQSVGLDFPTNQPTGIPPASFLLQAAEAQGLWLGCISPLQWPWGAVRQGGPLCPETLLAEPQMQEDPWGGPGTSQLPLAPALRTRSVSQA